MKKCLTLVSLGLLLFCTMITADVGNLFWVTSTQGTPTNLFGGNGGGGGGSPNPNVDPPFPTLGSVTLVGLIPSGDSKGIYTSEDGEYWKKRTDTIGESADVVRGNGQSYLVGKKTGFLHSNDAVTWTSKDSGEPYIDDITWGNGLYVAAGTKSISWSSNGTEWSRTPGELSIDQDGAVTSGNGIFVAIGEKLYSSNEGTKWIERGYKFDNQKSIAFGKGVFVAVGDNGIRTMAEEYLYRTTYSSERSWPGSPLTSPSFNSVIFNGSMFVAVGNSGKVYTSSDGASWVFRNSGVTNSLEDIAWSEKLGSFYASGGTGGNVLVKSTDGITWTMVTTKDSETKQPKELGFHSIYANNTPVQDPQLNPTDWTIYTRDGFEFTTNALAINAKILVYKSKEVSSGYHTDTKTDGMYVQPLNDNKKLYSSLTIGILSNKVAPSSTFQANFRFGVTFDVNVDLFSPPFFPALPVDIFVTTAVTYAVPKDKKDEQPLNGIYAPNATKITIANGNTTINGPIYAPNAELELTKNTVVYGKIYVRFLDCQSSIEINPPSYPE